MQPGCFGAIVVSAILGATLFLVPGCGGKKPDKSGRKALADEERFRRGYANEEWRKGMDAIGKGNKDKALGHFARAAQFDPEDPAYPLAFGQLSLEMGDLENAERALYAAMRTLEALQPEDATDAASHRRLRAEISLAAGDLLRERGHDSEAINAYRSATDADPGMARAHYELGHLFLRRQAYSMAESRFREALRVDPSMLRAQAGLAVAYHLGGDSVRAWQEIQDIERKNYNVDKSLRESVLLAIQNQRQSG